MSVKTLNQTTNQEQTTLETSQNKNKYMINTKHKPIFSENLAQKAKELLWIRTLIFILAIICFFGYTQDSIDKRQNQTQAVPLDLCSLTQEQINEAKLILPTGCPPKLEATDLSVTISEDTPKPVASDAVLTEQIIDTPPKEEPESEPEPESTPPLNSISDKIFTLNNGKIQTGQQIIDYVRSNPNGEMLYQAFTRFGEEEAKKATITLFFENGTLWEKTVGVCSSKHWINGDYRNCNYADINSNGLDVGLIQINTWYQRHRIMRMSGISCTIQATRDRQDPCNQRLIDWLHNPQNNINVMLEIYNEAGFSPWYGAKRAGIV